MLLFWLVFLPCWVCHGLVCCTSSPHDHKNPIHQNICQICGSHMFITFQQILLQASQRKKHGLDAINSPSNTYCMFARTMNSALWTLLFWSNCIVLSFISNDILKKNAIFLHPTKQQIKFRILESNRHSTNSQQFDHPNFIDVALTTFLNKRFALHHHIIAFLQNLKDNCPISYRSWQKFHI